MIFHFCSTPDADNIFLHLMSKLDVLHNLENLILPILKKSLAELNSVNFKNLKCIKCHE
jgi:hypothetical protein